MKTYIIILTVLILLFNSNTFAKTKKSKLNKQNIDTNISIVKNGILDFDKSITIGMAIDNYKYCNNTQWKSSKSENGRNLVYAVCDYKIYTKNDIENMYRNVANNNYYLKKREIAIKQRAWDTLNTNFMNLPIINATIGEKKKIEEYPDIVLKQKLLFVFVINYDNTFYLSSYGIRTTIKRNNGTIIESDSELSNYNNVMYLVNLYHNERLW